jgi:hypothetical protein
MELPDEWAGRQGRCPQCGRVLHVGPTRGGAFESPVEQPAPFTSEPQLEYADVQARPNERAEGSGPRPFDLLRNPVWLAAIAGGVVCVAVGLYMVFRPAPPREPADESKRVADVGAAAKQDDVFRPAKRRDDATAERGGDEPAAPQRGTAEAARIPPALKKSAENLPSLDAWNSFEFGVVIPPDATEIEIDGVALAVRDVDELAVQGRTGLVLPLGRHVVRFARTGPPRAVEPKRWFLDAYREAATQVQEDGRWSFELLLELSRRRMDRFSDPLVPHFWGNYYWQEGQLDAAARHYAWALALAPTFAPSYFNLAQLWHERGDDAKARRYLRLAELWNVQNAYGLSLATTTLRMALDAAELPAPAETAEADERDWYVAEHDALSARDRDMLAVLRSAAEFAPQLAERAKVLNNIGAYFEHAGKAELALEHYRAAAGVFGDAKLSREDSLVIRGILANMTRLCRKTDMAEYQRYERLQAMIQ